MVQNLTNPSHISVAFFFATALILAISWRRSKDRSKVSLHCSVLLLGWFVGINYFYVEGEIEDVSTALLACWFMRECWQANLQHRHWLPKVLFVEGLGMLVLAAFHPDDAYRFKELRNENYTTMLLTVAGSWFRRG